GLAPGEDTDLKDLVKATPLDRIVLETDSPYLPPVPFRGQRNEPKNVIIVGKIIAELKKLTFEEVSQQTTKNAVSLFKL
ncbi:TatD family hydrolase, partial [Candidatus Microgenomates bacterium]|nr:TatD family hydrolase [Candidatus Microgenomates bacterium]